MRLRVKRLDGPYKTSVLLWDIGKKCSYKSDQDLHCLLTVRCSFEI